MTAVASENRNVFDYVKQLEAERDYARTMLSELARQLNDTSKVLRSLSEITKPYREGKLS